MVQQVHTQPVVVSVSSTASKPTIIPSGTALAEHSEHSGVIVVVLISVDDVLDGIVLLSHMWVISITKASLKDIDIVFALTCSQLS